MQLNSGVYAIIFNDKNEVLLLHRRDCDIWEMPGGAWEENESPWAAAIREVREETGLEVEVERLVGLGSRPSRNELVFNFQCKITGGQITTTSEASEIRYFSIDELPPNLAPSKLQRIKEALSYNQDCFLKDISGIMGTADFVKQNPQWA